MASHESSRDQRLDNLQLDPRLRELAASTFHTPIAPNNFAQQSPSNQQQTPSRFESPSPYLDQGQTPGSDSRGDGNQHGSDDPKRPRACEACRGLKVRCEPDVNNPKAPCKRCAKANRECRVTEPSRKRQKKPDSRVAELEKKIDALTATLQAQKSGRSLDTSHDQDTINLAAHARATTNPYQQVTNGGYGSPYARAPEVRGSGWATYPKAPEFESRASGPPMVVAGQKRKHTSSSDFSTPKSEGIDKSNDRPGFLMDDGVRKPPLHEYADVVDRGLITSEMASSMFQLYIEKMVPHMPAVVFPPGTTAAEVRKNQPTLFLAILSSSSGSLYPKLQKPLTKEIMGIYAQRIVCNGEKTLELVQALHVSTLWYYPPEHFEELKFYQLIHMAAVMAIDIGLGKKNKAQKSKAAGLWRDHPWRRTPYPDPESIEARRAWLSSYFLCANAAMGLRRPNLLRWTSFMAECVEVLETSPDALPSDKSLCQWVNVQHIAEDIGTQFSMDDNSAVVNISDSKVQYALKGFELDLSKWAAQLTPESTTPTLKIMEHVVSLYAHEVALHVDHNVEEFKPPFTEDTLRLLPEESDFKPLCPAQVGALSTCLTSIDGIFGKFLALDIDTIRCLPTSGFVRVAYAVVVLIKMYFAAAIPNSELGKVIDKDNMKVEQYLDGLVDLFKAASAEERSRPSAKFVMVLLMLKTWFHRQRESKPSLNENEAAANDPSPPISKTSAQPQRNDQQSGFDNGNENTPLQLLSEVATGNSGGQSRSGSVSYANQSNSSSNWQDQQQQVSYPSYGPTASYSMNQTYGNMNMGGNSNGNIDPNLGLELGFSMGDNLEQAMGMTIGGGEFGDFFSDNAIFGGLMDSVYTGMPTDGF